MHRSVIKLTSVDTFLLITLRGLIVEILVLIVLSNLLMIIQFTIGIYCLIVDPFAIEAINEITMHQPDEFILIVFHFFRAQFKPDSVGISLSTFIKLAIKKAPACLDNMVLVL